MTARNSLLVAALAAVMAAPANAAPPATAPRPLAFADPAGDANAVNGQDEDRGLPLPSGVPTGPASIEAFDITSLTVGATGSTVTRRVRGRTTRYFQCTGYTATITLAGPPRESASMYRVKSVRTDEKGKDSFYLEYRNPLNEPAETTLRVPMPTKTSTLTTYIALKNPAKVDGNRITFVVTAEDLAKAHERLGALALTGFGADVRGDEGRAMSPRFDQLVTDGSAVWKVCPA